MPRETRRRHPQRQQPIDASAQPTFKAPAVAATLQGVPGFQRGQAQGDDSYHRAVSNFVNFLGGVAQEKREERQKALFEQGSIDASDPRKARKIIEEQGGSKLDNKFYRRGFMAVSTRKMGQEAASKMAQEYEANKNDLMNQPNGIESLVQKHVEPYKNMFENDAVRREFLSEFYNQVAPVEEKMRQDMMASLEQKMDDEFRADLMSTTVDSMVTAMSEGDYQGAAALLTAQNLDAYEFAQMSPEEVAELQIATASRVAELTGDLGVFDLFNLKQPDGRPGYADDPRFAEKVRSAQQRMSGILHQRESMNSQAQDQQMKRYKERLEGELWSRLFDLNSMIAAGEPMDPAQVLEEMEAARSQGLLGNQAYKAMRKHLNDIDDFEDGDFAADLEAHLYNGLVSREDIYTAYQNGQINRDTFSRMMSLHARLDGADSVTKSDAYKSQKRYLREFLTPGGLLDFDKQGQKQRALATREWERRVAELDPKMNPKELDKAIREITDDVVNRFNNASSATRRSSSGGGATIKGGRSSKKTAPAPAPSPDANPLDDLQRRWDAGELSEQELEAELDDLRAQGLIE